MFSYYNSRNGKSGVVFAKGGIWFFESIENEKVTSDKLDIKF